MFEHEMLFILSKVSILLAFNRIYGNVVDWIIEMSIIIIFYINLIIIKSNAFKLNNN